MKDQIEDQIVEEEVIEDQVEADLEETEAEEEDHSTEETDEGQEAAESQDEPEQPWPKKAENAVSRLKKERQSLRRQRDEYKREIDRLKSQTGDFKEPDAPSEDQFDSYSDFLDARAQWKAEQVYASKQNEQNTQRLTDLESQSEQLYMQERVSVFEERLENLKSIAPDYSEVEAYAENVVAAFPEGLRKQILAVDDAPKALYNLAKEGRLENLSYMPMEAAMAEIVQAQYRQPITAQGGYQAPTQQRKVSAAPKPIKSVSGTGKQSKQLHEMSVEDIHARFTS